MATLQNIRSKGPLLVIVIGLALFAFIAGDAWKVMQPHHFMQLRKTLILVQNQSSYRQIIVRFGQIESERLIDFFYLQAGGQHILAFINLLADIGSIIVLRKTGMRM